MVEFEGNSPILRVQDLQAAIAYYVDVLGFQVDWQGPFLASVSRGGCCLFVSEGDQGHMGTWVWVGVSDAGALYEELTARGARIRHQPTNYEWAYEMQVEDLDGNVLRMGSESIEGDPYGEWLDMHGGRWGISETGEWTRLGRG